MCTTMAFDPKPSPSSLPSRPTMSPTSSPPASHSYPPPHRRSSTVCSMPMTLADYNIQMESTLHIVLTLHLVLCLRGGAKKHKKKTYTKPKKIKHKKKKVKLAMLQFYKVDDSGKVTCLSKNPSSSATSSSSSPSLAPPRSS